MNSAWITLLTQPSYLVGVLALQRSLRRSGTEFPLIVMITAAIGATERETLRGEGCQLREVIPLAPSAQTSIDYAAPQFPEVWTKLRVWELSDIERAVFLDADMVVLRNMDELFSISLPPGGIAASHACRCNPHHKLTYPASWVPDRCFYTHADGVTSYRLATAQDYFNSGLLVLQPDPIVFARLQAQLAALHDVAALPFADQDLLNEHFAGNWQTLPYTYNALKTLSQCHPTLWDLSAVKNLHFILGKPWQEQSAADDSYAAVVALWWEAYRGPAQVAQPAR